MRQCSVCLPSAFYLGCTKVLLECSLFSGLILAHWSHILPSNMFEMWLSCISSSCENDDSHAWEQWLPERWRTFLLRALFLSLSMVSRCKSRRSRRESMSGGNSSHDLVYRMRYSEKPSKSRNADSGSLECNLMAMVRLAFSDPVLYHSSVSVIFS